MVCSLMSTLAPPPCTLQEVSVYNMMLILVVGCGSYSDSGFLPTIIKTSTEGRMVFVNPVDMQRKAESMPRHTQAVLVACGDSTSYYIYQW